MRPLHALAPHSEIVVSTGSPKHDRRLSDRILAAFGHAYAEGAFGVAAVLRRALEEAEGAPTSRWSRPISGSRSSICATPSDGPPRQTRRISRRSSRHAPR